MSTASSAYGHRRRRVNSKAAKADNNPTVTRQGNEDPAIKKGRPRRAEPSTFGRFVGLAAAMLPFTAMLGLIFGGCCSNVRKE